MLVTAVRANNVHDAMARLIGAAVAGALASFIFAILLSQFALANFWHSVTGSNAALAEWTPMLVIGISSGAIVGVALGLLFKGNAFRVATIAALLQLLIHAALVSIPSSAVLAIGLVLGAFIVDRIHAARPLALPVAAAA